MASPLETHSLFIWRSHGERVACGICVGSGCAVEGGVVFTGGGVCTLEGGVVFTGGGVCTLAGMVESALGKVEWTPGEDSCVEWVGCTGGVMVEVNMGVAL